jgi:hypothetical protein
MRAKRTELERRCSEIVVQTTIETNPGLRDAIRAALDAGATPREIRRRYGVTRQRRGTTALVVEWLVDEWERDHGQIAPDESIDCVR